LNLQFIAVMLLSWIVNKQITQMHTLLQTQAGYYRVDHDYIINCARLAKNGGCSQYHLVSSVGANKDSLFLAARVKVCRLLVCLEQHTLINYTEWCNIGSCEWLISCKA